ncbi:lipopolysaccharide biosynthesis protein [Sporosarcina koreensis]|uniref:lipopolysaccharide biosynthesis protein n=1 Tax=Sporosarcina koreensis TaxID=334735 RepID=UPI000759DCC0|nr:lipopolysaccharide biosynthesis protein [Sporosarcina koreensis]
MPNQSSLNDKTIVGLFWSFLDLLSKGGIQLGLQIILARLLLPDHFGLLGMVIVFITISTIVIDSGFSQALIRDKNTTQLDYTTVFYFNLFISFCAYGLLFVFAPSISDFYSEPQLVAIIRVISLVLIVNSLGIIQRVKIIKKIDFKTLTKINVFSVAISGGITITMALLGYGVWSLVMNMILAALVQTILLWFYNKWIPSLSFSYQSFTKYFGFGSKLLVSSLIDTFYNNIFYVIIGKVFSTTQLGYYSNAVKFRDLAALSISTAVERVSYPVLSSIQDDDIRLKLSFKKVIKTTAFVYFPIMAGLAAVAFPLFGLVIGDKWLPSVVYFQLLCIAGMLYPIHLLNLTILQVKGRSDLFLVIEVVKKVILTVLILFALTMKLGIIGLIMAALLNSFLSFFVNSYFSGTAIGYSTKEQLKDLLPAFIIAVVMGVSVYCLGFILPANYLVKLVAQVGIGIIMYVVLCKILHVQELRVVYQILFAIVLKKKKAYL